MILTDGDWQGRGRFLHRGQSLGIVVNTRFALSRDDHGDHLKGQLSIEGADEFAFDVRVIPDETGTYDVTFHGAKVDLQGTAKLESEPNMGMLFSDQGLVMSFALFSTSGGCGCRGFLRDGERFVTWEMALERVRASTGARGGGGNVVSLQGRRKRR